MHINGVDPDSDSILLAFNGELIGYVREADTEEGYIVQAYYDPETMAYRGFHKKYGRVDILGYAGVDTAKTIRAKLNSVRKEMGLDPLAEAA